MAANVDLIVDDEEEDEGDTPSCCSCGDEIIIGEDVVQALVVYPYSEDGEMVDHLELYATEEGEPVYQPLFLDFSCFEDLIGQLNILNKDMPPVLGEDSPVTCDFCGSGIFIQENCVRFDHGEIVLSKKTKLPKFLEALGNKPQVMCIGCAIQLSGALDEEADYSELWSDIANEDECPRCTLQRCWRGPACGCRCHTEK